MQAFPVVYEVHSNEAIVPVFVGNQEGFDRLVVEAVNNDRITYIAPVVEYGQYE